MVERRSEVVEHVSRHDRETDWEFVRRADLHEDFVPHLLVDEGIGVSFEEGSGFAIQALQVFVRPRELFEDALK
jgi:hypothetical protein